MSEQRLREILNETATLSLATVDDDGRPHAANVNFVADGELNLLFISDADSAHARHIAARPRIAATAYPPFETPDQIRGVQLRGECRAAGEEEFDACWPQFVAKFPYAAAFEAIARTQRFYRIRPTWLRLIDNRVHFGFKWETTWPAENATR